MVMDLLKRIVWNCPQSISYINRSLSSNRTSIVRTSRQHYLRPYPTLLVNPDGSTLTIRYHEPREIIRLPFDMTGLSESEKQGRMERRKPKTRLVRAEDVEKIKYDARKYLKYVKK